MSSRLGLDKVTLLFSTDDISIREDFPATVQNKFKPATGEYLADRLLYYAGDMAVNGTAAHFNTPNFQFGIRPHKTEVGSIALLQFSAGAYADSNEHPLDCDGVFDVAGTIQRELKTLGLDLPIYKGSLVRLDIAQNCALTYPVATYAPAFAAMETRRRVNKTDFGGTGFYVGNKQREIGFYDKGAQMQELNYPPEICPRNTLRPEVRLKNASVIRDSLSCENLPELRKVWTGIKAAYKKELERDVFRAKVEKNIEASLQYEQMWLLAKQKSPSRPLQFFMKESGKMRMIQELGFPGAVEFLIKRDVEDPKSETGKRKVRRIMADLQAANFALGTDVETREGHQVKALYQELKRVCLDV